MEWYTIFLILTCVTISYAVKEEQHRDYHKNQKMAASNSIRGCPFI